MIKLIRNTFYCIYEFVHHFIAELFKHYFVKAADKDKKYPTAPNNGEVYKLHGIDIPDPFHTFEDLENEETKNFIKQQNAYAEQFFEGLKFKNKFEKSFQNFENYFHVAAIYTVPGRDDFFYCAAHYKATNKKDNLYTLNDPKSLPGQLLIDAQRDLGELEELVFPAYWSRDCSKCAVRIRNKAMDKRQTIKIYTIEGTLLPDELLNCSSNFISLRIVWDFHDCGFFYMKNNNDGNDGWKLFYHRLGTLQREDILFQHCKEKRTMSWAIWLFKPDILLPDHLSYCLHVKHIVKNLDKCTDEKWLGWTVLFHPYQKQNKFEFVDYNEEERSLLVLTNYGHSQQNTIGKDNQKMIIRTALKDAKKGPKHWSVIVPHQKRVKILTAREIKVHRLLLVKCMEGGYQFSNLYLYNSYTGQKLCRLNPENENVLFIARNTQCCILMTSSWLKPTTIYECPISVEADGNSVSTKLIKLHQNCPLNTQQFNALWHNFECRKFRLKCRLNKKYKSPLHFWLEVYCARNVKLNSSHPVLMRCYGGFGRGIAPHWDPTCFHFMHHFNGILAVVHPRGDGFLHKHGFGSKRKRNVIDDIQQAAEFLIHQKYTKEKKIALLGCSNGGLMAMACALHKPSLFGAVVAFAGPYDLLRYHKMDNGKWLEEFGNPELKSDFEHLKLFSPPHNVQMDSSSPAILLLAAENDSIVHLGHTLKMIATLQQSSKLSNSCIAYVYPNDGHFYPFTDEIHTFLFLINTIYSSQLISEKEENGKDEKVCAAGKCGKKKL